MTIAESSRIGFAPSRTDLDAIRTRVQAAGSSFYWAMRVLPRPKNDALFAIYAFCREVDDIADGDQPTAAKLAGLAEWQRRIERLYAGMPDHPITRALDAPRLTHGLKQSDFLAIIAGMEMDARGPIVAPDFATLDLYCDRVASAVGRLCIQVFGESGAAGQRVADRLGRALQLTNILRDVQEDAAIGRLYLPAEALARAGILITTPADVARHPLLPQVMAEVGAVAEQAFADTDAALAVCDRRAMRPARMMMKVYERALAHVREGGWRVMPPARGVRRAILRAEKLGIALYHALT